MATKKSDEKKIVVPDFRDVDKKAVEAAQAAVAGGKQDPLTPPASAKTSTDSKGTTYTRWAERAVVQQAYRTVTPKGLMDVTVLLKVRQSDKNAGRKVFAHFYINNDTDLSEGHESMNERSIGAITTLLQATDFMPSGGSLKGTLLNKMFPSKGQPGTASPLVSKSVIVNIVQQFGQAKDRKTGKPMVDGEGNAVMERRDAGESFLPDTNKAVEEDEDEE